MKTKPEPATPSQISANQQNAQLSTGPRTPEGKAVSSRNAFKFGLTAKDVVLPTEDASAFEALHAALVNQWEPASDGERLLVDDMAAARWRFRRIEKVQTAHMAGELNSNPSMSDSILGDALRKFHKYLTTERRLYESARRELAAIQKERKTLETIIRQEDLLARAIEEVRHPRPILQNEPNAARPTSCTHPSPSAGSLSCLE